MTGNGGRPSPFPPRILYSPHSTRFSTQLYHRCHELVSRHLRPRLQRFHRPYSLWRRLSTNTRPMCTHIQLCGKLQRYRALPAVDYLPGRSARVYLAAIPVRWVSPGTPLAALDDAKHVADTTLAERDGGKQQKCSCPHCERWRAQLERVKFDQRVFALRSTRNRIVATLRTNGKFRRVMGFSWLLPCVYDTTHTSTLIEFFSPFISRMRCTPCSLPFFLPISVFARVHSVSACFRS